MNDVTVAMLAVTALDNQAVLRCSPYTLRWFVAARLEISDGVLLRSVAEHRDTPDEAVHAYLAEIRRQCPLYGDHYLIARSPDRVAYQWNGASFALVQQVAA